MGIGVGLLMPVTPAEIEIRLSGGADNTDPKKSFGGAISDTVVKVAIADLINNIFDTVFGEENEAGYSDVRILYLRNSNVQTLAERIRLFFATPPVDVVIPNPNSELPDELVVADYPYAQDNADPPVVTKQGYITMGLKEAAGVVIPARASVTDIPGDVGFTQPVRFDKASKIIPAGALDMGDIPKESFRGFYLKRDILQNPPKNVSTFSLQFSVSTGE